MCDRFHTSSKRAAAACWWWKEPQRRPSVVDELRDGAWEPGLEVQQLRPRRLDGNACHARVKAMHLLLERRELLFADDLLGAGKCLPSGAGVRDGAPLRVEVGAGLVVWVGAEEDQFPDGPADPLLAVDVVRRSVEPDDIARPQLPLLRQFERGPGRVGPVVAALPAQVAVATLDHAGDTPSVVVVDGSWRFGREAPQQQRVGAVRALVQDRRRRLRPVERDQVLVRDDARLARQLSQPGADGAEPL